MVWLIVVLVLVVVLAVVGARVVQQSRSRSLQQRFGPEYDRLVEEEGGDRKRAEAELTELAERRDAMEITDLAPDTRRAYAEEWRAVQERFIDEPRQTVADADALVQRVMADRGYPVDELDDRIDMVAVDHPELAENYRAAHAVQVRSDDEVSTDDLRDAFRRYRELFAELLAESTPTVDHDHDDHGDEHEPVEDQEELPERGGR
jgi:hypothetical protein